MNREFFAIGMMEYGGIGLLITLGLFVAALDLVRALLPGVNRSRVPHRCRPTQKHFSRSDSRSESETNQ